LPPTHPVSLVELLVKLVSQAIKATIHGIELPVEFVKPHVDILELLLKFDD
jgi:hypothetical protein